MDQKERNRIRKFLLLFVCAVIGFLFGILIMSLSSRRWKRHVEVTDISDRVQREIKAENIRTNLRKVTRRPHLAGTPQDLESAEYLRDLWLEQGLDSAKLYPYDVLLQHPPTTEGKENRVELISEGNENNPVFRSTRRPDTFGEKDLQQEDISLPYHAYSANGDVTGDLVYVNYGRLEDYEFLQTYLIPGINFTGKIVICRLNEIPSHIVMNAEKMKVAALILYPDPADKSTPPDHGSPYPDGPYLPKTAAVFGSLLKTIGDPLTPGYPSTAGTYRIPQSAANLPSIPVHPIGFSDAEHIFRLMTGPQPPPHWRGSLDVTYQVGPGFNDESRNLKVRVFVNSTMKQMKTYNTIGYIRGSHEPDRYVILGNHRDAWCLGAVDPTGGTAVMMEISRVFGMLKQEGWRPRRTMVFASWGAEEFALTGSVEWTEQFSQILSQRAVAYLNLDIAVTGTYVMYPQCSPTLLRVVSEALKKVEEPYPSKTRKTLYDSVAERLPLNPDQQMYPLDGGTDFEGFFYGLGVSSISAFYFHDFNDIHGVDFYSLYHTHYETFRLVDEYIDPGFLAHRATGQFFAEMMRNLAESTIINADVTKYSHLLDGLGEVFRNSYQTRILTNDVRNISVDILSNAMDEIAHSSNYFQYEILPAVDTDDPVAVRAINDRIMNFERAWLSKELITGFPVYRHTLLAPVHMFYGENRTFPGIVSALRDIDSDSNEEERWSEVDRQITILTNAINSASSVLIDFLP